MNQVKKNISIQSMAFFNPVGFVNNVNCQEISFKLTSIFQKHQASEVGVEPGTNICGWTPERNVHEEVVVMELEAYVIQ